MVQFDDSFSQKKLDALRLQEEEDLLRALAAQYGYEFIDLRGTYINPSALRLVDESIARNANVLAFELNRKTISLAIRNPNDQKTKAAVQQLIDQGYEVRIFMTSSASLEHGWQRYADQKATTAVKHGALDIDTENITAQMQKLKTPENVSEYILSIRTLNSARRISETLEAIFAGALSLGASDVHIEPEENGIRLRYRLDGVLHDIIDLDRSIYERLISRLKLLSGMILNIKNEAQDGRFTFSTADRDTEVRSSIIPGASGESMVMRLLDPTSASFRMDTLGLNAALYKVMEEELKRPNGLIITTGPTGSGKTTALYAFLQTIHKPGVKIITIENPVEYKLDNIVQTQVEDDYTFADGLKAILRQDPDIIMVGEIRDRDVAETAIHAAQTGHLVFTTLHTNSAVGAFPRLMDLGVDSRILGASVNIILGQRLVRVLCDQCKVPHTANADEAKLIRNILTTHPAPPEVGNEITIYEATGCDACNQTGFKGRQAVFEAIRMDKEVEEAVIEDSREHVILEAARAQGIPTMAEDGIDKVIKGITSLTELERVVDLTEGRRGTKEEKPATDEEFNSHIV